MLADVQALGPISPLHQTLNLYRTSTLADIQFLACPPLPTLEVDSGISLDGNDLSIRAFRNRLLAAGINWNDVMRTTNRRYDRCVEIARMQIGAARLALAKEWSAMVC